MKEIKHKLINNNSEKVINLILKDKILISETGKIGKLKTTEREFSSNEDALKNFYKQEWEALKKGFVLNDENAKIGQTVLHKFIGGAYTGALSLEHSPHGIFVYEDKMQNEEIVGSMNLIDNLGKILKTIKLPKNLAWNIEYSAERNSLILDIDHHIYEFDIEKETFYNLGQEKSYVDSFSSVSNDKIAFATMSKLTVVDNQNRILFTKDYKIEIVKGNSPFCGKLSKDGKLLAFHNKVGEIQIIDAENGTLLSKINGKFEMVFQFEFADNNKLLIVREQYGTWGMRYFDLSTNEEILMKEIEIPEYTKDVNAFCFNADQTKLVLLQRADAHVFDFINKKLLHSFKIEHLGKKCEIKFVGEKLGVRTDYGCFSIYNV
ncbi:hypothetical protein J2X69_005162 [Algoriphagus sp. 4150]|uniref:hypothetical protein n=1 Tax=Algoriphagus sp. 4150 TaxID=2817756 RepID=UPI00285EFDD6|nr:hypothetical protein [Algoriphagus sp. 4150]MDR7132788.1 hypothetical protein [Algoriphagus sp. 4150]